MLPPNINSANNAWHLNSKVAASQQNNVTPSTTTGSQSLDQLREQIKNGSYTVDFGKLATSILNRGELNR
ncbi:flagellar biosynthesis anti-sigma factor FlgM [Alicyclobacillus fastidiosus]|uniref:Flagellar biosynthesis anti-sigma factor FlgM n=1 Tax=Alicyclobacillus fastidiosus TaxID=392011 RepID=A0ABY6ZIB1_9BACL|nr:flagellar biosynthesis anti-sigma factor FlgM [Alicyclobacillus fastidiosus]WAH42643.1 flagellar biosynthesis anti-sigma factor FlgM [Alicyclobacillus fastidiosus]GMA64517.1 hypothetical protein GCM10025859_49570 [Alicyclobacillus fastidiosus]